MNGNTMNGNTMNGNTMNGNTMDAKRPTLPITILKRHGSGSIDRQSIREKWLNASPTTKSAIKFYAGGISPQSPLFPSSKDSSSMDGSFNVPFPERSSLDDKYECASPDTQSIMAAYGYKDYDEKVSIYNMQTLGRRFKNV